MIVRKATTEDLESLWNRNIAAHPDNPQWVKWKAQFLADNQTGRAATFAVLCDGEPVGEGTLLFSPECKAIRGRLALADGQSVTNINALRIQKEHEGKGYISALVHEMEAYARQNGYASVTIGVEAKETRNLAIYLHWGYNRFVCSEMDGGELVLYYAKDLG